MLRFCPLSKVAVLTLYVLAFLIGCSRPDSTQTQAGPEEQNRRVVLAFYDEGLIKLQPRSAFERYASEDFVEHKPDVPEGTREGTIVFLEGLIKEVPKPTWKVIRTVAEGDLVFLHASFTPADGASPYAVADVFRLKDGKIVEHWDVVAPPVKQPLNPHSRF